MTLSLYFLHLRLLMTIGQSGDDSGPLASNWPCMAKARNLEEREKESMSCRISQEKRETRLQIMDTNEREAKLRERTFTWPS